MFVLTQKSGSISIFMTYTKISINQERKKENNKFISSHLISFALINHSQVCLRRDFFFHEKKTTQNEKSLHD